MHHTPASSLQPCRRLCPVQAAGRLQLSWTPGSDGAPASRVRRAVSHAAASPRGRPDLRASSGSAIISADGDLPQVRPVDRACRAVRPHNKLCRLGRNWRSRETRGGYAARAAGGRRGTPGTPYASNRRRCGVCIWPGAVPQPASRRGLLQLWPGARRRAVQVDAERCTPTPGGNVVLHIVSRLHADMSRCKVQATLNGSPFCFSGQVCM